MNIFLHHFSVSGVDTYIFVPPLVMFIISALTSMGGLSGAFMLLPFQMSVLGYTAPGVSATNFVYNVIAIPLGVYRHIREGRMAWPLLALLVGGTLPGVFLGYYIRVTFLPEPKRFQFFVGLVLGYMAVRTLLSAVGDLRGRAAPGPAKQRRPVGRITGGHLSWLRATIEFQDKTYSFPPLPVVALSLLVGVIGGAYGIGGGAIMAPFCISVLNLPVYVVSGASLFSTWIASVLAAFFYGFVPIESNVNASPDWLLGALFGLGGMAGIYAGAWLQKRVPVVIIKLILGIALIYIAVRYTLPTVRSLLG
jgi:uncharacterized membrane protein YfcA